LPERLWGAKVLEMSHLKSIYPVLPARRVEEAMRYYVERLGFALAFGGVDAGYVGLRRDGIEVHLQMQFEKDFQAGTAGQACLRIEVDDPDALFEELKGRGVFDARTRLRDTEWGTREFSIHDPDGNTLTFQRDV
jgi:uncharacterized glyoxalase superfamily protein PhnB